MKVILDANVFVSAAIQRGPSYRIVDSWFAGTGDFEIVMGVFLVAVAGAMPFWLRFSRGRDKATVYR